MFLHMADFPSEPCSVNFAKGHTFYSHSFPPFLLFFCSVFSVKVLHNIHCKYVLFSNCVHFPLLSRCTFYINCLIQSNVEVTVKKNCNQFYNYLTVLGAAIKCKPYSEITVEIGTQLKAVKITSNIFAV